MKSFKYFKVLVLSGLFLISSNIAFGQNMEKKDMLSFHWAFFHKKLDGSLNVIDFSKRPVVKEGEFLRIYLRPEKNAFIYLYMFDAQKNLTLVFPTDVDFFNKDYEAGKEYMLPSNGKWFVMGKRKGIEQFYLLASTKRLTELEDLTKEYIKSPNDELKAIILEHIKTVNRTYSSLSSPTERKVAIVGSLVTITRSKEVKKATFTEAETFYFKTLRIKHE